jgi:hypothetical protein
MSDFSDRPKREVPLYKGRLDTATPTAITYADYLYDFVEPHFAYYKYDVFLSKFDNKIHIEVYSQEAYDYVIADVEDTFGVFPEEKSNLVVSLLVPEEK